VESHQIRETFLHFFEARGHRRYESAPLVPQDPTVLLTIAGMLPFKPYFMGDAEPPSPRATSYQKCVRTNDIENVGVTTRHLSMFEMLGNFSFGDYFKRQAIAWAWELSVDPEHGFGFDPERIWATVWEKDDSSADIWLEETDVPASRIQALGADDNYWWTHAAGPGGPNTELYYDRGDAYGEGGGPAINDERYLEFYNVVFMQHVLDAGGTILGDLPKQNVDTGMGLERMAVLLQGVDNVFETDWLRPMLDRAVDLTGRTYGEDQHSDVSLRVVAEHARTSSFLIADGVLPAKEGRGYVLRRLLRRAIQHAHRLGATEAVAEPMIDAVIATLGDAYPELVRQRELVTRVAVAEESDFRRRLDAGLEMVDTEVAAEHAAKSRAFSGDTAFKLHDTFGFPIDLTAELAADAGLHLDRDRFDVLMTEQRERARAAAKKGGGGVPVEAYREAAAVAGVTQFLGYEALEAESTLAALLTPAGSIANAQEGDEIEVVLPRTPFYAEGGGQVGDGGILVTPTGRLEVLDTQEAIEGLTTHRVRVVAGEVTAGQDVHATVDGQRRLATGRAHSATHVLHATIREVLGDHAQQAGSLVQPGRLRFDFPHFASLTHDEVARIEETMNARVLANPHVTTELMALDEAKAAGATANFGDKYSQEVRVVSIGDFSKELCGGTHVPSGAVIGPIHIVREESIGSNTRRIEALTGLDAYRQGVHERMVADELARLLDVRTDDVVERVTHLMERLKQVDRELTSVRRAGLAQQAAALAAAAVRTEAGDAIVTARVDGVAMDDLRSMANEVRGRLATRGVIVLGSAADDGKAQLICTITGDLAEAGLQARPILHPAAQVVGGGAGGKGDMAQAGGKEGSRLDEALQVAAAQARDALAGA